MRYPSAESSDALDLPLPPGEGLRARDFRNLLPRRAAVCARARGRAAAGEPRSRLSVTAQQRRLRFMAPRRRLRRLLQYQYQRAFRDLSTT